MGSQRHVLLGFVIAAARVGCQWGMGCRLLHNKPVATQWSCVLGVCNLCRVCAAGRGSCQWLWCVCRLALKMCVPASGVHVVNALKGHSFPVRACVCRKPPLQLGLAAGSPRRDFLAMHFRLVLQLGSMTAWPLHVQDKEDGAIFLDCVCQMRDSCVWAGLP